MRNPDKRTWRILAIVGSIVAVVVIVMIVLFNAASCQRIIVDIKSDLSGGLDRTINVYTANGELLATYSGKIDIEANEGGYIKFDFNGKRYMYYNCFIETIANIE